jgi:acyl-CoA reductase-like NAD-dependent aldehyde dehydrogenase
LNYSKEEISNIVKKVIDEMQRTSSVGFSGNSSVTNGVFDDVNEAVAAAKKAQLIWTTTPKKTKEKIIAALRKSMHEHAEDFSHRAVAETGMGRVADKIIKHHNAADATPGFEDLETRSWSGDKGFTYEDYAPYGIIAAITPSTHPVPVLFNSLVIIITAGNSVVFNVHPAAKKLSAYAIEIFNDVIVRNGGPKNLACVLREPTLESASKLFKHRDIELIAATGGPALVKAAFESGKKVIAAGPGNPPVIVDETADLKNAAKTIIEGASFDNNILCIAEKEVFVVDKVFDSFMNEMEKAGAVRLQKPQIEKLLPHVFIPNKYNDIMVNREFVGKNASVLAKAIGLNISDDVRLLFGECPFECPFVQEEQMLPYLPIVRVRNFEDALNLAVEAEHGYHHTAMIHSNNFENITRFTKAINTSIVVVNGSSLAGNGGGSGEGYFSHTIASPTGEGICTPRNFARVRRLSINKSLQIK